MLLLPAWPAHANLSPGRLLVTETVRRPPPAPRLGPMSPVGFIEPHREATELPSTLRCWQRPFIRSALGRCESTWRCRMPQGVEGWAPNCRCIARMRGLFSKANENCTTTGLDVYLLSTSLPVPPPLCPRMARLGGALPRDSRGAGHNSYSIADTADLDAAGHCLFRNNIVPGC